MQALREGLRGRIRFVWKNADVFIAMSVAGGVVVAEVVGHPSTEVVDSAILVLLGATAFVLLRDRDGRGELDDLRLLAGDAISDRPYQVVTQENHWNLKKRDESIVKVTEQLRFTRNDVSTIADWSTGDGRVERYVGQWKRAKGEEWLPAEMIHKFSIRNGEKVIYSLDAEHCRGDELYWCVERHAVDRFPNRNESVSLEARTKSDHPRVMQVTWPPDATPSHVEIRFEGRPARTLPTRRKNGRAYVEEKIAGLPVGKSVKIAWTW
jgi:hypothetical protein